MSSHLLRSRRRHDDGSGDQANGSATVSLSEMIKRAHGRVRTSIALIPAVDTASHVRVMDGYDTEDAYDAEVATLSGHLAAVEAVLYPVARRRLDGGRDEVAAQQRLSRRIERLMRLIEGQKWHGTTRYFGPNTSYETVAELMTFEPRSGHIIDLHRRPGGNLKTQLMLSRPLSL